MESGMKKKNRHWSLEQKREAVERMKTCGHVQLAKELGIQRKQLYEWRMQLARLEGAPLPIPGREQQLERENQQLREALAKKVLEADFLQGALRRIEARRRASDGSGATVSTKKSES
jgi:transposase-like protein